MPGRTAVERRVFFALWPEDCLARQFEAAGRTARQSCSGRSMRRETLHMTLAFIGSIPPARVADLLTIAANIRPPSFDLTFDRLQWLRHKKIVWASAGLMPPGLQDLAAELGAGLEAAGFQTEARPLAAHVTLLRNAHCDPLPSGGELHIDWPVRDFVLAESQRRPDGASYTILGRWPLAQT